MRLKVIVHEEPEGGYWAEVRALPGCATQADDIDELLRRVEEAAIGWLGSDRREPEPEPEPEEGRVYEIAV